MADYLTIILFFIYSFGFGYTLLSLLRLKEDDNFFFRNAVRLGVGLSIIPLLGVVLNQLYIPLHWVVFFVLSVLYPAFRIFIYLKKNNFIFPQVHFPSFDLSNVSKKTLFLLAILGLALVQFYIMDKGAFAYPWLEDGDPWHHAVTTRYIVEHLSFSRPTSIPQIVNYLEPYPPGHDLFMAILYQTSHDMMWTLKYFNALLLALSILFFGIMAYAFTKSYAKSLFATFLLVAIPCYLGHFIWSETLAIVVFFPAFYCVHQLREQDVDSTIKNEIKNKYLNFFWITNKWMIPAILLTASVIIIQPIAAFMFGVFLMIYWFVETVYTRKLAKSILAIAMIGLVISLFLFWIPMKVKFDIFSNNDAAKAKSKQSELKWQIPGSADRVYSFNDFFITKPENMINQPIGVGIFITILFFIFLVSLLFIWKTSFGLEHRWLMIVFLWFIVAFLAVNGRRLPIYMLPFRMWPFMAIALVFLATEGLWFLFGIFKNYQLARVLLFLFFVIAIMATSGYHKYTVNTAIWPFNNFFSSFEEANAYSWLYTLPKDTTVFEYCSPNADTRVMAYDKLAFSWDKDVIDFRKKENILNHTNQELYSFLKQKKFDYFIIDGYCLIHHGENETNVKLQEISQAPEKFQLVFRSNTVGLPFVFKVI